MKKKPKHLDIILNEDDSVGTHPNLVVKTEEETLGFTITHSDCKDKFIKLPIEADDIVNGFKVGTKPSYLSNHSNELTDKPYIVIGRAKQSLLQRFIDYLISLTK